MNYLLNASSYAVGRSIGYKKFFYNSGLGLLWGGLSIYEGGGVQSVGIIKRGGGGRLTCCGLIGMPGGRYV